MNILPILELALGLAAIPPMVPDTPPAVPVERLATLKTMEDVIGVAVLSDGTPAPSNLRLPELLNRRYTIDFMMLHYPAALRDDIVMTDVPLAWVLVDRSGTVGDVRLVKSSGQSTLDSLSVKVLQIARFRPALVGDDSVGVWVPYPARVPPYGELAAAALGDKSHAPVPTPFTTKPVLLNRNQVEAAIIRVIHQVNNRTVEANESFNRAQRLGGKAIMWVYIDQNGNVANAVVKKRSGVHDLDVAADNIARMMRFSPARNNDEVVDVWIEMPILFKEGGRSSLFR